MRYLKNLAGEGFEGISQVFHFGVLFVPIGDWNVWSRAVIHVEAFGFVCTYRGLKRSLGCGDVG